MSAPITNVVILATSAQAEKITALLRSGGGSLSTTTAEVTTDPIEALNIASTNKPDTTIIFAHVTDEPKWGSFYQMAMVQSHIALVVLSDDMMALGQARSHGVGVTVPGQNISSSLLAETVETALSMHNIKQQQGRLQGMLDLANQRFRDMADQFADWLWEIDTNLILGFSSARKRPVQDAVKGSKFTACFLPEEKLRIEDDFAELLRNPRPFHERDYWSMDPYGTRICWSVSGVPVEDAAGNVTGFRGIARDVSATKTSTDQLYYLVNHDALTGLVNRTRAYDDIARTLRSAKREKRTGALLTLDVDKFGTINHNHGHLVGDKLLIHIAQVLKDNIRTGDLLARLDGDMFALMFRDLRPEDLPNRLERLQQALASRPLTTEKGVISLALSGGIALYPTDGDEADTLLTKSLDALKKAKERGPNKIEMYSATDTSLANAPDKLEWVEFVTECLTENQERMVLHYQPIVSLGGKSNPTPEFGEFYEVLVRMVDRQGELIAPSRFISTAEEYGMVPKIDKLVTTRAVEMLEFWQQQGRKVHLSVNLSPKSFDDEEFLETARSLLKNNTLPKHALVFEITETAILRDLPKIRAFMEEMNALGVAFALDDCGVGYSSFNTIRHLPLNFIKIDGSFVKNLQAGGEDEAFIKALADVAKQKNIATVAEMVEHQAALTALKSLGIDYGQGFYFAPPAAELPAPGTFSADRWEA